MPDEFHDLQPQLLSRTLHLSNYTRDNTFTASDLNLYYDVNHPLWHKRPDWFLAVDVPRLYDGKDLRLNYVTWQEGKNPYVVVEFLSPGTEFDDLGRFYTKGSRVSDEEPLGLQPRDAVIGHPPEREAPPGKLEVYERYLRVPHYVVYSRYTQQLRHFKLEGGQYQEQALQAGSPLIWLADLEIGLGIWQGTFDAVPGSWLRWCDRDGNWFVTDTERAEQQAEQASQQAEQERLARENAQAQLLQAARNLLATGMEPGQVATLLGLSETKVRSL